MWALLWHGLPVAALLLWGAFCITNSLWYDEAYSASMVSLPWKRLIYITATDDHSPFYYVLLKSFYQSVLVVVGHAAGKILCGKIV